MKTTRSKTNSYGNLKRILIFMMVLFFMQGCFIFGSDDNSSEVPDVCEGVFNEIVTQDRDGIGVTSARCTESERGQWIDGGCYCHGDTDG